MKYLFCLVLVCTGLQAQVSGNLLELFRSRMDSVEYFEAEVKLLVDISFVNMPEKKARVIYEGDNALKIESEDFVMIPKKGLDLTFREIFRYPYISLATGQSKLGNYVCQAFKLIPEDPKADFSIASIWLDIETARVIQMEISTKKNGVFTLKYEYNKESNILPNTITVEFEVTDLKIPLRYVGKEANIDKTRLKEGKEEKGVIYIHLSEYNTRLK